MREKPVTFENSSALGSDSTTEARLSLPAGTRRQDNPPARGEVGRKKKLTYMYPMTSRGTTTAGCHHRQVEPSAPGGEG